MTREEIKYASKDYVNYLLDKQEYHNEKYTEYDIKQAFEKGAEFANNNLDTSSLWHEAKEKPRAKEWMLVQFGEDEYEALSLDELGVDTWIWWCKNYNVIRWAYIKDLLPNQFGNSKQVKGGEQ